jgi:hypothetical protein
MSEAQERPERRKSLSGNIKKRVDYFYEPKDDDVA